MFPQVLAGKLLGKSEKLWSPEHLVGKHSRNCDFLRFRGEIVETFRKLREKLIFLAENSPKNSSHKVKADSGSENLISEPSGNRSCTSIVQLDNKRSVAIQ